MLVDVWMTVGTGPVEVQAVGETKMDSVWVKVTGTETVRVETTVVGLHWAEALVTPSK